MRSVRALASIVGFGLIVAGITGCQNAKKDEVGVLTDEATSLRAQLDERNRALDSSENERRNLAMRLSDLERQAAGRGPAAGTDGAGGTTGFEGIDGADVSVGAGTITVAMEGDVLFDSGKTALKSNSKKALDQVASVLSSKYGSNRISIEGHTDTDPIKRSGHKSNFHLGFERAFAVREYLITRGVSGERMILASWGPNDPKASKPKSRRVEVVVTTK